MDSKVRHGKLTVKYELHLGVLNYISLHLSNVVNDTDVDSLLNLHAWIQCSKVFVQFYNVYTEKN